MARRPAAVVYQVSHPLRRSHRGRLSAYVGCAAESGRVTGSVSGRQPLPSRLPDADLKGRTGRRRRANTRRPECPVLGVEIDHANFAFGSRTAGRAARERSFKRLGRREAVQTLPTVTQKACLTPLNTAYDRSSPRADIVGTLLPEPDRCSWNSRQVTTVAVRSDCYRRIADISRQPGARQRGRATGIDMQCRPMPEEPLSLGDRAQIASLVDVARQLVVFFEVHADLAPARTLVWGEIWGYLRLKRTSTLGFSKPASQSSIPITARARFPPGVLCSGAGRERVVDPVGPAIGRRGGGGC